MSRFCGYDKGSDGVSDCKTQCDTACDSALLGNSVCDSGTPHAACLSSECGWDMGDCDLCSLNCDCYAGHYSDLGDGVCQNACSNAECAFDGGDCYTRESPLEVYVSSTASIDGDGSSTAPFSRLYSALTSLWAPNTVIYLLAGRHQWLSNSPSQSHSVVTLPTGFVEIATLLCVHDGNDLPECADLPASVALTLSDVELSVTREVVLRNVNIVGGFSLVPGCDLEACTYCPAATLNLADGKTYNDQGVEVFANEYAPQSLCDFYQDSYLFLIEPAGSLTLDNVLFADIRYQHKALILNECGDLTLHNVTFTNVMARRSGLAGGVIQTVANPSFEPYSCGTFRYSKGLVELVNNGYEYSTSSYYSGFLWLAATEVINITQVLFQFNYMMVGKQQQVYGSALMYFTRFRQLHISNCTFMYNIADTGAAFYVYSGLDFPLVVENGQAVEQSLDHILIEDCLFLNNTGRKGSVVYLQFLKDHQNVMIRNCQFINNFATEVGVLDIINGFLIDRYTVGETIEVLIDGSTAEVFIPPIRTEISSVSFVSNYAPYVAYLKNIANLRLTDCLFFDDGNSLQGFSYSQYVMEPYLLSPRTYPDFLPQDAEPAECLGTFLVENSHAVHFQRNDFEYLNCARGSPGLTVIGINEEVVPI